MESAFQVPLEVRGDEAAGFAAAGRSGVLRGLPILHPLDDLVERKHVRVLLVQVKEIDSVRGLVPIEASYVRSTPRGPEPLGVTLDGDPQREQFFRTHYAPADLTANQAQKLRDKLSDHREYVRKHGEDMPEVADWQWGAHANPGSERG